MFIVAFYDISDNRKRDLLASRLLAMGLSRVQRSVFIGRGGVTLAKDVVRLGSRYVEEGDSLIVLVVPVDSIRNMLVVGRGVDVGERLVRVI